jgi:imidazole glycerol phosphate synthase subunit HisF
VTDGSAHPASECDAPRCADDVFIPFTIGGGVRSAEDAQAVLDPGADKPTSGCGGGDPVLIAAAATERSVGVSTATVSSTGSPRPWASRAAG